MVQNLFLDVIRVSLTTSVVIAVLLLLSPLIHKNYTAKWRYFVWLILAVRLLIPFSLSMPQAPIEITPASQDIAFNVPIQNTVPSPLVNQVAASETTKASAVSAIPSAPSVSHTITLNEILSIVWVSGSAFFMLYHLIGYFLFRKSVLRFSRPVEEKHTEELWHEIKEEMKISRNIQLLVGKTAQSPMMTGFFKPLLLMPDLDYSDVDLTLILKHELIHYKRRDIWYKLLLVCANAVHWFNPLVYLMTVMSNKDIEMACDSELIRDSDATFRKQYSETILTAIHKGNQHRMVFSTYFYGGKKIMKERFANIFDMRKKRKGIMTLCAIIMVVGVSGASVAYGVNESKAEKTIDNITLLNAKSSYELDDSKFVISYGVEKSAVVPLTPDTDDQSAYFEDKAVYISDEVTAVAYGDKSNQESPIFVLISNDVGETWNNYIVTNTKSDECQQKYMGFTTRNDGWLLLTGDVAMGHQENRIFQTSDGGKTWSEIGNTNNAYAHVVTGAGFANESIGFVSFRYDTDINPVVYRTGDDGKTWTRCSLEIPDSFKSITTYATALSPVFNGANGVLPVTLRNNNASGGAVDVTVQYVTSDYGKTWTFNEKYNLALIWADAWKTRDGKGRYEIMDSKMQTDFRSTQLSPDNYVIRWSSPWVVRYDVSMDGDDAVVTYFYTDSSTSTYKGVERLMFGQEGGRTVVTDCKTETDMQEYVDTSNWKSIDTGQFKLSLPSYCETKASDSGGISIIFTPNCEEIGGVEVMSVLPITELVGNHAEILKTESLEGCKYPATKVIVRRTKPAAANDSSYVDETHVYLYPESSKYVVDLSLVSYLTDQRADEIAKSIVINTDLVQMRISAGQWARAVGYRDGKAQYDLMSEQLKNTVYDEYQKQDWVTGPSSLWLNSYIVQPGDNTAAISYTYMPSSGIEGFYLQTLTFSKENGQLVISAFTEPKEVDSQGQGTVIACLNDGTAWLSAANLNGDMFSDMTLSINGKTKSFPWKTYGEPAFLPKLSYADVDGDGRSELIVNLCEGEGTGTSPREIHVINPEDLSEIAVQSPLDAIKSRVVSSIDESGVKITIDNQKTIEISAEDIIKKGAVKDHWFSNLAFGSIVNYSVKGNSIAAEVGEQITPASFLGFLNLTYEYKDNQLKVSGISFSTNDVEQ